MVSTCDVEREPSPDEAKHKDDDKVEHVHKYSIFATVSCYTLIMKIRQARNAKKRLAARQAVYDRMSEQSKRAIKRPGSLNPRKHS